MKIKQILVKPILFTLSVLAKIIWILSEIIWDRFTAILVFKDKLQEWSKK